MKPETVKCMNEMVNYAREGNDVYPMMWSASYGRATVSSAVRCAKKRGFLEQNGLDGVGNAKWAAKLPEATHKAPEMMQ